MAKEIIKTRKVKFINRFLKIDLFIISFWIIAGMVALALESTPIRSYNSYSMFIISLVAFLFLFSLFSRAHTQYVQERKTITEIYLESEDLKIQLLDFDNEIQRKVPLSNMEMTLRRSYRHGTSKLHIDFWIVEKNVRKKLLRQHCNKTWDVNDVKDVFLTLKDMKEERLSKKEKRIIENLFA